ncbi:F-box/kelch-repeat protein SKIP25-like [Nicotiana tabacum]|uniref:F-box/kelch-repeat protein SKIP25-like n=1 Tax=Nicotiana tabacum TaxID=4097 RepID=A0A1S4CSD7_TOBAC|nr:F-box/kelch-repeat protein SKIP25-like [Nicotiana tomentosiformis]XP_016503939.1 PREDICTED: F-box/kelch-repeat protein SKIP25-like [Nicotiana tabacum]
MKLETGSNFTAMEDALKRIKIQENDRESSIESSVLIPGLPDHLAHLCLSNLQPSLLYGVSKSWRRLIYTSFFPPFYSLYVVCSPTTTSSSSTSANTSNKHTKVDHEQNSVEFFCLDPISSKWKTLPNPPSDPPIRVLRRHPSFISRSLSIQSLTVSERMVLIAATTHKFLPAFERPLGFNPLSNEWFFGPKLPTPRRWCGTTSVHGNVYIASGIGSVYDGDVARSLEKWDVKKKANEWKWEKMAGLKDGRFSREAVDAIGYRGKLCMVNIKGRAVKQGAIYDITKDEWEEMREGMLAGWNGPAATTINDESEMYVVDEIKGSLSKYISEIDEWEELIESCEHLKGAEQISVGRGRVCVICSGGRQIAVVDVTVKPANVIRVVNTPPEMEAIALHILPRISIVSH